MCLLTYCIQVKNHPKKLWVEKSNNHRGIHIKSPNGTNITQTCSCNIFLEGSHLVCWVLPLVIQQVAWSYYKHIFH